MEAPLEMTGFVDLARPVLMHSIFDEDFLALRVGDISLHIPFRYKPRLIFPEQDFPCHQRLESWSGALISSFQIQALHIRLQG